MKPTFAFCLCIFSFCSIALAQEKSVKNTDNEDLFEGRLAPFKIKKQVKTKFDRTKFRKSFVEATKSEFEFVDDLVAQDRLGIDYWMVRVRPKRSGDLVIGYSCTRKGAENDPIIRLNPMIVEDFPFTVGKQGQQRFNFFFHGYTAYPFACKGDEIVIPFRIGETQLDHEFKLGGSFPKQTSHAFKFEKNEWKNDPIQWTADGKIEVSSEEWIKQRGGKSFECENQVPLDLHWMGAKTDTSITRGLTLQIHWISGLLRWKREGRFNIFATATNIPVDPYRLSGKEKELMSTKTEWSECLNIPIIVKDQNEKLLLLAHRRKLQSRWDSHYDLQPKAIQVRVGDVSVFSLLSYSTLAQKPSKKVPQIKVSKRRFEVKYPANR